MNKRTASVEATEDLSDLIGQGFTVDDEDPDATIQRLLQAARCHLGMDVAFLSEFTGGQRVIRQLDTDSGEVLLQPGHADPEDITYCKQIVNGKLPRLIHNARELEGTRQTELTEALGIGSYLGVPVRLDDGTVYGTFCTFCRDPKHDLNERDVSLLSMLADLGAALVQKRVTRQREDQARKDRIESVIHSGAMYPVWQPIVEVESGAILGLESLSRFPQDEARTPADWFDDAAAVDLSGLLEARAIRNALSILDTIPESVPVGFNLSAAAVDDPRIHAELDRVPLDRVVLELTEHTVVEDYDHLARVLDPLRQRGLRIAVDDAGAGHASFRHILRLRPEYIKLDMSLVRDIDSDVSKRALAVALEHFACDTASIVIAEGVETRAELDALNALGIRYVQGFYLHKPASRNATLDLMAERSLDR